MGKALGGLLRLLVMLAFIGLLAYNTWEIQRLRTEVARLREGGSVTVAGRITTTGPGSVSAEATRARSGVGAQVARAQQHAERAQDLVAAGRYADAQRELSRMTSALAEAQKIGREKGSGAIASLKGTVDSLSRQVSGLWESAQKEQQAVPPRRSSQKEKEQTP